MNKFLRTIGSGALAISLVACGTADERLPRRKQSQTVTLEKASKMKRQLS